MDPDEDEMAQEEDETNDDEREDPHGLQSTNFFNPERREIWETAERHHHDVKVEQAKSEVCALKTSLQEKETCHATTKSNLEQEKESYRLQNDKLEQAKSEVCALKTSLQDNEARTTTLKSKLDALTIQFATATNQTKEQTDRIAELKREKEVEVGKFHQEFECKKGVVNQLTVIIDSLHAGKAEREFEVKNALTGNTKLRQEIDSLHTVKEEKESALADRTTENTKLRQEFDSLHKVKEETESALADKTTENSKLSEQLASIRGNVKGPQQDIDRLRREATESQESYENELLSQRSKLREVDDQTHAVAAENSREELELTRGSVEILQQGIDRLKCEAAESQKGREPETDRLKREATEIQNDCDQEIDRLNREAAEIQESYETELSSQRSRLQEAEDEAQANLEHTCAAIDRIVSQYRLYQTTIPSDPPTGMKETIERMESICCVYLEAAIKNQEATERYARANRAEIEQSYQKLQDEKAKLKQRLQDEQQKIQRQLAEKSSEFEKASEQARRKSHEARQEELDAQEEQYSHKLATKGKDLLDLQRELEASQKALNQALDQVTAKDDHYLKILEEKDEKHKEMQKEVDERKEEVLALDYGMRAYKTLMELHICRGESLEQEIKDAGAWHLPLQEV